jgi:hypothetical protein
VTDEQVEPGDRNFYRPAILWGAAAAVAAFLGEYVANEGSVGRALLLAAVAALLVGLFFARLLTMKEGRQRRPRYYTRP